MKNRRFSSPFISFYEIVIIPTSGSFLSVWKTVIPSTFPCSSVLFLDLPDLFCFGFPNCLSFFFKYIVHTWYSVPAEILSMLKREEGPLQTPCKDPCIHSHREKTFPLCISMCDHTHTVERNHICMYKYIESIKKNQKQTNKLQI